MEKKTHTKETEACKMAVSMAVIPLLKGDAARSLIKTMEKSKLKPYSESRRLETERKLEEIIAKKTKR